MKSSTRKRRRARLWMRVSNTDQIAENQRAGLIRVCEERDLTVDDHEYLIEGLSAWKGAHREQLEQALADANVGEYDVLVIWAMDRLTRQGPEEALRLLRMLNEAGVEVLSVQEPWLSMGGPSGTLLATIISWKDEQESARRSERNKAAYQRSITEGKWAVGATPIGYRKDAELRLEIDPEEAKTVRLIYDLYDRDRLGVRRVCAELAQRGVLTRRGSSFWPPSTVERLLKDTIYVGRHRSGISAPRIVSDEQWQRVQARRQQNRSLKRSPNHLYALQGRAKCICGAPIRIEHPNKGRGRAVYYCKDRYGDSYRVMRGADRCTVPRRRVSLTEAAIYRELMQTLDDPIKFESVLEQNIEYLEMSMSRDLGDAGAAKTELRRIEDNLERIEVSRLKHRISDATCGELREPLEKRAATLQQLITRVSPETRRRQKETQSLLIGAKDYLRTIKMRRRQGDRTWRFSFDPDYAESEELQAFRSSSYSPVTTEPEELARTLDRLLTGLNAEIVFDHDSVKLNGSISVDLSDDALTVTHPYASGTGES